MAGIAANVSARETARLIGSDKVEGTAVRRSNGDKVGTIERVMIDKRSGKVAYAVMSFGGFLGIGDKLFAVPLPALSYRPTEDTFVLHVDKETLKRAPGFDKNHWPNMSDRAWGEEIYSHYGYSPYWE